MTVTEAIKVIKMFADDKGNVPFSKVEEILKMATPQSVHVKGISLDEDLYNRVAPSAAEVLHNKQSNVISSQTKGKSTGLHGPSTFGYA